MMQNGMMPGPVMMLVMMIVMILVLGALIAGIVWLVRTVTNGSRSGPSNATETLEARYARGEIDRDEYLQRRNDLEQCG